MFTSSCSPSSNEATWSLFEYFQNSKILFLCLFISFMYDDAFSIFFFKFLFFSFSAFISWTAFFFLFSTSSSSLKDIINSSKVWFFSSISIFLSILFSLFSNLSSTEIFSSFFFVFLDFLPLVKKYLTFPKNDFLHSKKVEIIFSFSKYSFSSCIDSFFKVFNFSFKVIISFSVDIFNSTDFLYWFETNFGNSSYLIFSLSKYNSISPFSFILVVKL